MLGFRVVIDTDCLYSLYLRDILLEASLADFYRPLWSLRTLEELEDVLQRDGKRTAEMARKVRAALVEVFPDSTITNYQHIEGTLGCTDVDDEHVLAAAIIAQAGAIVTKNLRHFPKDSDKKFGVEVLHPDNFLMDLADLATEVMIVTIAKLLQGYDRPGIDARAFAECMNKASCSDFATYVNQNADRIDSICHELRIAELGLTGNN